MTPDADIASLIMNDSAEPCTLCTLGPPPDFILKLPPPPLPTFLVHSDYYPGSGSEALPFLEHFNSSPCKHSCEWRAEGIQYVEMPQQGTLLDDTWLLVLISSCVGLIFVGVVLATLLIKCKLQPDVNIHTNDDASQCSSRSNKNSTLSTSTASSGMQTTTTSNCGAGVPSCLNTKAAMLRLQSEAVLYPCTQEDSRVMWATLTPRGTTRHYLEEHTYETIGNVCSVGSQLPPPPAPGTYVTGSMFGLAHHQHKRPYSESPTEHTYAEPPVASPVMTRPKEEKAFDNTAFVDYEEPLSMKNEYYQLEDVLEPCDPIFSVQGLYQMPTRGNVGSGNTGSLRPRVSSPTRIEHPNLPPLNLQPTLRKHSTSSRKNSISQHTPDCTLLRGGIASATYIPTI